MNDDDVQPMSRHEHLRHAMHNDFIRDEFVDELAAYVGKGPSEELTREDFAAYDAHRLERFGAELEERGTEIAEPDRDDGEPV